MKFLLRALLLSVVLNCSAATLEAELLSSERALALLAEDISKN